MGSGDLLCTIKYKKMPTFNMWVFVCDNGTSLKKNITLAAAIFEVRKIHFFRRFQNLKKKGSDNAYINL